jgi:hypothetical protein
MLKQIVKVPIPNSLLFDLLEKTTLKTDKYYLVDINCYKKILFHKYHEPFLKRLRKHYYFSKLYYLDREFNYASFTNIVRQICKSNNVAFESKIIYHESTYTIDYFIYYGRELVPQGTYGSPVPQPPSSVYTLDMGFYDVSNTIISDLSYNGSSEMSNTITLFDISRNVSMRSYSV